MGPESRENRPLLATHHHCCKTNSGQEWNVGMLVGQGVFLKPDLLIRGVCVLSDSFLILMS